MILTHNCNITHCDLKATNCLVDSRSSLESSSQVLNLYAVKVMDFGISNTLDPGDVCMKSSVVRFAFMKVL